jgi:NADH-quinone oxidoreductase subunit H
MTLPPTHAVLSALLQTRGPADEPTFTAFIVFTLVKMLVLFTVYMVAAALLTLAERKISAWIQGRHGPNRAGYHGLLQPVADGVKNFLKEESLPAQVNKPLFILAPMIAFLPAMLVWAVIPFGAPWGSRWGRLDLVFANLPVGFLFILAIASLGVYGIVLAGWSSNNKYALLGGIRSSAQMVSYEVSMGMSLIPVMLLAGNVTLVSVVNQQAAMGYNIALLTLSFVMFMISSFAETNRLPFDLPEAESELITGYHTEYSAMKFSLFFIAEYCNIFTASALMATLFLGGYDIPFMDADNVGVVGGGWVLLSMLIFFLKTLFFLFVFIWVRWTLPRFRYDQLMSLGWRVLLPLALGYIVLIATALLVLDRLGVPYNWMRGVALFILNVIVMAAVFVFLDRGKVISPAYGRISDDQLAHLRRMSRSRSPRGHLTPQAGD